MRIERSMAVRVAGGLAAFAVALLALAGCSAKAPEAEVIRPVLTSVATSEDATVEGFVGVIAAQVSIAQSFRIGGTLLTRSVEIGDAVTQGQALATLDATSYALALDTAQANLLSAQAQAANAKDAEARLRGLNQTDVVSQSGLEQAVQQSAAADASLAQAEARLTQAKAQLGYATLSSSIDGVVTAVGAEPGAVIAAGQSIVTIAQPAARDLVIDVPQDVAAGLKLGDAFEVSPQLAPDQVAAGVLREIAPQADPVTRTWRLKIGLTHPSDHFWLGTTATARRAAEVKGQIRLPETAIRRDGTTEAVWVVTGEGDMGTVHLTPVKTGPDGDGKVSILEGLSGGERVVTAGVNSLVEGQKVRL